MLRRHLQPSSWQQPLTAKLPAFTDAGLQLRQLPTIAVVIEPQLRGSGLDRAGWWLQGLEAWVVPIIATRERPDALAARVWGSANAEEPTDEVLTTITIAEQGVWARAGRWALRHLP